MAETNRITSHYTAYEKNRIALVNEELTGNRNAHADDWATIRSDVPYQLGNNPFNSLYNMALEMIRGELQLWGSSFPSSVESLKVLANVANAVVTQLVEAIDPLLKSKQVPNLIIQGNTMLVSLEILGIYNSKFEDFRDLCKPDLRHETVASNKLLSLRNDIVDCISTSITALLQASQSSAASSSSNTKGALSTKVTAGKRKSVLLGEDEAAGAGAGVGVGGKGGKGAAGGGSESACDIHPNTINIINCCRVGADVVKFSMITHEITTAKPSFGPRDLSVPLQHRRWVMEGLRLLFAKREVNYENGSEMRTGYLLPVLVGIPGVGKSRLLNEYAQFAPKRVGPTRWKTERKPQFHNSSNSPQSVRIHIRGKKEKNTAVPTQFCD
jgi:hypothetical protein